jgi:CheY-like chemotaxis protein
MVLSQQSRSSTPTHVLLLPRKPVHCMRDRMSKDVRLARIRILVVEDHPATRDVMRRVLEAIGFTVSTAATAGEGIERALAEPFHVLVSDIGLPDGTGCDVVERVRAHKRMPAIAVSGFGMTEDIDRAMAAGFDRYLVKPYPVRTLVDAIIDLVEFTD